MAVSSSEEEFVAISDVCNDLVFAIKFIEFMGVKIRLPVTVMVYNKGAIFMTDNKVVKRNRHINTRYLLISEYVEDGIIKIQFLNKKIILKTLLQRMWMVKPIKIIRTI